MGNMLFILGERSSVLGAGLDTSSELSASSASKLEVNEDFFSDVMRVKRDLTIDPSANMIQIDPSDPIKQSPKVNIRIRIPSLSPLHSQESLELPPVSRSPRPRLRTDL